MNSFDIIGIILIIAGGAVFWKKGILGVLLPVVAIVTSLWLSFNFSSIVLKLFGAGLVQASAEKPWVGYMVAFVVYIVIIGLAAYLIKNFVNVTPLKIVDSILGSLFGIVLASLLIMVVMYILTQIGGSAAKYVESSGVMYPVFKDFLG